MMKVIRRANDAGKIHSTLSLPFELRQKSRLRTTLDNGDDVALFLPRGTVLRDGEVLESESGVYIGVRAAREPVSTASSSDGVLLARTAYHLGNRHVPVQIGNGWLRYGRDHVLDDMVQRLGLTVVSEEAPFEPEIGAYRHAH